LPHHFSFLLFPPAQPIAKHFAMLSSRQYIPWSQLTRDERIELALRSWRLAMPALAVLASLYVMSLPVWVTAPILPQLAFIGVITWSIRRPDLMRIGISFLLGLIQDLWLAGPIGVEACLFALVAALVASQHLVFAARPFRFEWLMISIIVMVHAMLIWMFGRWLWSDKIALLPIINQAVLTIALYPALVWLHARLQRKIVDTF
jgi:rod shape-determining protein MreD